MLAACAAVRKETETPCSPTVVKVCGADGEVVADVWKGNWLVGRCGGILANGRMPDAAWGSCDDVAQEGAWKLDGIIVNSNIFPSSWHWMGYVAGSRALVAGYRAR